MAIKRSKAPAGTLVVQDHNSKILKGNPLGDPHVRKLAVWLPPQYEANPQQRFPVLYDLVGFTGTGLSHTNWKPFGDNVPERAARLIHEQKMGPASHASTRSRNTNHPSGRRSHPSTADTSWRG